HSERQPHEWEQPLPEEQRGQDRDDQRGRADGEEGRGGDADERDRAEEADLVGGHRQTERGAERKIGGGRPGASLRIPWSQSGRRDRGEGEEGRGDGQTAPADEQRRGRALAGAQRHGGAGRAPRDGGDRDQQQADEHSQLAYRRRRVGTGDAIGFIGLGNMGAPMAGRLLDGGYALVLHDVRRQAAEPLLARGATWAASPAEVAAAAQ